MNEKIEEIHCITDEGKIAKNEWGNYGTDFHTMYIKNWDNSFSIPQVNLLQERYISSVESYKYLNLI